MPKKNLYVKEKDIKVFDTAEMVGGDSLSNIVIDALNLYIREKKIKDEGFDNITINIGEKDGDTLKIRKTYFYGKYLSGYEYISNANIYYNITIYATIKGKILVYVHESHIGEYKDSYRYHVYSSLEEVKKQYDVPDDVFEEAIQALNSNSMTYLDV